MLRGSFDLSAYKVPRGEDSRLPIRDITTLKEKTKKISFIDESVKMKNFMPSPDKYSKNVVWTENELPNCRAKGAFIKEPRITSTELIYKAQAKFPTPASPKYNKIEAWSFTLGKVPGTIKVKENKVNFTEEHKFFA